MNNPQSGSDVLGAGKAEHVTARPDDSAILERVVHKLREVRCKTGMERTIAIGELVLNEFFGGDAKMWRDRRRNKNNSIRRLAERADCPLHKSALNEAVGISVAVAAMPHLRTSGHITASHIAAVLVLPPERRCAVLGEAERLRWSVRELKQHVCKMCRSEDGNKTRPDAPNDSRVITLLERSVRGVAEAVARVEGAESPTEELRESVGQLAVSLSKHAQSLDYWAASRRRSSPRLNVLRFEEAVQFSKGSAEWVENNVSTCPDMEERTG